MPEKTPLCLISSGYADADVLSRLITQKTYLAPSLQDLPRAAKKQTGRLPVVVHVIRDPRAVIYVAGQPDAPCGLFRALWLAVVWIVTNRRIDAFCKRHTGSAIRVHTQDIYRQPAAVLERIAALYPPPVTKKQLSDIKRPDSPNNADSLWHTELAPGIRLLVTAVTILFTKRYGF